MPQLKHRIDLALLISVDNANPNGDPLNRGLPRRDRFGRGVISAVCIKRKLRNALEQMGQEILISPPEYPGDDLAHRLSDVSRRSDMKDEACRRWFDVRAFGQTFAVRGCNFSGIRGAVSLQSAVSVCPVRIVNQGITSCFSGKKSSIGFKTSVEHGLYVLKGSIIPGAAAKNRFSEEDCIILQKALLHMTDEDCSSSRPAGSVEVRKLLWWEHPGMLGAVSPSCVFGSVSIRPAHGEPKRYEDYRIDIADIPGVKLTVFDRDDMLTAVGETRRE